MFLTRDELFRALSAMCLLQMLCSYSMVAMDMDGTLLNENHEISDRSLKLLQSLSAQGVLVALATGRSGPAVRKTKDRSNTVALLSA